MGNELSRRRFLRTAAKGTLVGAGLPSLGALLQACGPAAPASLPPATPGTAVTSAQSSATRVPAVTTATLKDAAKAVSVLPTYIPGTTGPRPDFPSAGPLYEDGFTYFPSKPTRSWTKDAPGLGSV